jgi:hypothetical protein
LDQEESGNPGFHNSCKYPSKPRREGLRISPAAATPCTKLGCSRVGNDAGIVADLWLMSAISFGRNLRTKLGEVNVSLETLSIQEILLLHIDRKIFPFSINLCPNFYGKDLLLTICPN